MKKYIIIVLLFSTSFITAQATPGEYIIKNIKVNTKYADFGTVFFGADKVVFSSPGSESFIRSIWKQNRQPYLDLYIGSVTESGEIIGKQKVKGNVNTRFHEAGLAFTEDLKTVYFTANNIYKNRVKNDSTGTLKLQLFKAVVSSKGEWINIEKLPFNSDHYSTGHPALSADGKKLYFISDRPESIGKSDIFVVDVRADGSYSQPKNLGRRINTVEKEMFPFIGDDNIMYFSSNGHPNHGHLDVFASKIFDNTMSKPLNLGNPVNSYNDDFAFVIKGSKGYFSSNREGGKGDDDIYRVEALVPLQIECAQFVSGKVKNIDTQKELAEVAISLIDDSGNMVLSDTTRTDGEFRFKIDCNSTYKIVAAKTDFLKEEQTIVTANDIIDTDIKVSLNLTIEKIRNKKIAYINPIIFDENRWNISFVTARELDKIVKLMKENPTIIVETRSHTDSRGNNNYNLNLSSMRAKSIVNYIISKGIGPDRIIGKGFGETELLNKCSNGVKCTKLEHQQNDRTEFYIVDYK